MNVLLKFGHENAEMQKRKFDDVTLRYSIAANLHRPMDCLSRRMTVLHTCQHTKVRKLDIKPHLGLCTLSQI